MASKEEQETLRLLTQHVSRAFYEPKFVIILDTLARHPVLRDDDLAGRIGLQPKELNKVIAVLSNDCLVKVYRQNELKEGAQRSVGKSYYYIDYELFCNVVKWRIAKMRHKIDHKLRNEIDNKGYICPQCKESYTPLQADKLMDMTRGIFACEVCHAELVDNENSASVQGSKDRMMRFNHQMRFIREGLQKSESMKLPKFDVAGWVKTNTIAELAQRQQQNGGAGGKAEGKDSLRIAGANVDKKDDGVSIVMVREEGTEEEERKRREREMEAQAKRAQNALPAWHLKSTITGDLTALGVKDMARQQPQSQMLLGDESLKGLGIVGGAPRSNHRQSFSSSHNGLATAGHHNNGVDIKPSVVEGSYYDRYYASLAAASTPASAAGSVAATPSFTMNSEYGEEEEDRKPNIDYLDSLNGFSKRSRSVEDVGGGGARTPKMAKTEGLTAFTESSSLHMDDGYAQNGAPNGSTQDPSVMVNGVPKPLSQVTEEDHDLMTPEEYTDYFQILEDNS